MEHRKQMTFYVSFWEAINNLTRKDQLPVIRATIEYGLFGEHNESLTASQKAFFALIKPTLDNSRKKASSGKQGGSKSEANSKQTVSKPQANSKQTASEGEGEYEAEYKGEAEYEAENECLKDLSGGGGEAREATAQRLALIGLQPGEYLPYVTEEAVSAVLSLSYQLIPSSGRAPTPTDRRNIFTAAFRHFDGQWKADNDALDLLRYAWDEAAAAGKPGVWSYVNGIRGRLSARGITTLQQAREFDETRPDKEELA